MWACVKEKFGPFKVNSEGRTQYMYCDKNGNVTVGVGNMIDTVAKAQKLVWHVEGTQEEASEAKVAEEHAKCKAKYADLKSRKANGEHVSLTDASVYRNVTDIRVFDTDLYDYFYKVLAGFDQTAATELGPAGWAEFPADAQLAVLAIKWKVGGLRSLRTKHNMTALYDALMNYDFTSAAKTCAFAGSSAVRKWKNMAFEYMFTNAATVWDCGANPAQVLWPTRYAWDEYNNDWRIDTMPLSAPGREAVQF